MNEPIILSASLWICQDDGYAAIRINRKIKDRALIKQVISAAEQERPILILPVFRDKLKARAALIDAGILYQKDNECFFTF